MRWFEEWLLLPQRIALHEPSATAVIADVHLGYSAARQRLGDAIPSRTVAEELQPLVEATRHHKVCALVIAGDLFENGFDADLCEMFRNVLQQLDIAFAGLVPGNHDRGIDKASASVPVYVDGYDLAGWRIVHGDCPLESERMIAGHWHPAVRRRGRKLPCFMVSGHRLILPAFSLDAAGVEVRWHDWDCIAIDGGKVAKVNEPGKRRRKYEKPRRTSIGPRGFTDPKRLIDQ